jgi:hypothetical protein
MQFFDECYRAIIVGGAPIFKVFSSVGTDILKGPLLLHVKQPPGICGFLCSALCDPHMVLL